MIWIRHFCDITERLDELAKIGKFEEPHNDWTQTKYQHYILINYHDMKTVGIRVPGGTVGEIYINNGKIESITIFNQCFVSYPDNISDIISSEFIGKPFSIEDIIANRENNI